ncbi:MAG: Hsp20/alpha crystallin family protein [Haloarculaceae archaeon]
MARDNPFEEIEELLESMGAGFEVGSAVSGGISVDVCDEGDAFVVTADVPGVEKDDLEVTLSDRTLRIEADHESEREEETGEYIRRERTHTESSRSVRLPESVDEEGIEATYSNGVLTVTLPKHEPEGGTRIEVE